MDGQAANSQARIEEKDIRGLKYFDQLAPLLERLHDVGCQRDRAGNRSLHFDHYCMLVLLFFFNPVVKSLRGLQQASQLKNVQKNSAAPERRSARSPNLSASSIPKGSKRSSRNLADTSNRLLVIHV